MPIPPYDELTAPILQWLSGKKKAGIPEIRKAIGESLALSYEEKNRLLPSGNQTVLANRIAWAVGDLYQAGLLSRPRRGVYQITEAGLSLAKEKPTLLDRKFLLKRYPAFEKYINSAPKESGTQKVSNGKSGLPSDQTPEETMDAAFRAIRDSLKEDLKAQILAMSFVDFEYLCVDILVAMGYGGSREKVIASVTKPSHDGGIDGYISEDRLGLNMIYVQAKHYTKGNVGRPELQQLAGALDNHSEKGVFITSSDFSKDAVDYAAKSSRKIVLINGDKLADLMMEYNLGVNTSYTYAIKKVDSDYFERE